MGMLKNPSRSSNDSSSAGVNNAMVGLYIHVSGSSVYDVCTKKHEGFTKENDAVRPSTADEREEVGKGLWLNLVQVASFTISNEPLKYIISHFPFGQLQNNIRTINLGRNGVP